MNNGSVSINLSENQIIEHFLAEDRGFLRRVSLRLFKYNPSDRSKRSDG